MDPTQFETGGGVRVSRTAIPFDPALLAEITQQVEARRGGVLSSGMEYPGRYSRWHMAYVDPCIELIARGRRVTATALNDRGRVLLPVIADCMARVGEAVASRPDGTPAGSGPSGSGGPRGSGGVPGEGAVPESAASPRASTEGGIPEAGGVVAEEDRGRRPTVFS